jgi:NTP pyrophosphatase (non-canonical NTP hydrolase)
MAHNRLTDAEDERLTLLSEECSEVIQAICKIQRHGYQSTNQGELPRTNRDQLQLELGHVMHAVRRMMDAGDLDSYAVFEAQLEKNENVEPFLHHQAQQELRTL